jgi:hypothetical protein
MVQKMDFSDYGDDCCSFSGDCMLLDLRASVMLLLNIVLFFCECICFFFIWFR